MATLTCSEATDTGKLGFHLFTRKNFAGYSAGDETEFDILGGDGDPCLIVRGRDFT